MQENISQYNFNHGCDEGASSYHKDNANYLLLYNPNLTRNLSFANTLVEEQFILGCGGKGENNYEQDYIEEELIHGLDNSYQHAQIYFFPEVLAKAARARIHEVAHNWKEDSQNNIYPYSQYGEVVFGLKTTEHGLWILVSDTTTLHTTERGAIFNTAEFSDYYDGSCAVSAHLSQCAAQEFYLSLHRACHPIFALMVSEGLFDHKCHFDLNQDSLDTRIEHTRQELQAGIDTFMQEELNEPSMSRQLKLHF